MDYNKNSDSVNNIKNAFCDESAGHVRYMIMSEAAERDGNHDLARLYRRLSDEELSHARIWYAEQRAEDGVSSRIAEEGNEAANIYPSYAARAELEGYEDLADRFIANGKAEAGHREMLMRYAEEHENGNRYKSHEDCVWRCRVCGYRHVGETPPTACPLCDRNHSAYEREVM